MFKDAGIKTIHKAVAIRHAISAQKMGVDILSIDGKKKVILFHSTILRSYLFFLYLLCAYYFYAIR